MRWLLVVTCLLLGCSAKPGPAPATPTPTPTVAATAAPEANWSIYYGDAGGVDGGRRMVNIWSDGSVYARENDDLRKLVGRIPPTELAGFAAAMQTPEVKKLQMVKDANMVTSLTWLAGADFRRYEWPTGSTQLPEPMLAAVDELEKAQAAMQPAEDDQHLTVGTERLAVTRSQLTIPAVGGMPSTWSLEAGKHRLSVQGEMNLVEELKGRSFPYKEGQLKVTDVHNGIVEGTFPGGSFKTDVTVVALP